MDISNEASVDPFKIGPSTICGRTIAFRVLFCKSMSHLRYQTFHMVLNYLHKLKNNVTGYLSPLISCLHPRNPQGILVMVSLIAFVLRRYGSNVKSSRNNSEYRRKHWRNMMRDALTYEGWAHAAKMLDKENPRLNESNLYDEELVKSKLQELRHRRHDCSLRDIIFGMRADLIRNLGNMCNSELHKGKLHVPGVIKDYIDEVSTQLRMVCDSNSEELSLEEKLSFMHETRHSFGRTALLLSGGASFGAFHVGVAKTLVEHKLLPRIIAGSSVGSVMCAVIATKSWPELQSFFEDTWSSYKYFEQLDGVFAGIKRVMTRGALLEIQHFQLLLRHLTNNLTFQEAYDLTGRILGITVCSARKHEPPRVLNYLTSPHVVIWSAVTASCAFPGLFEAQELMAKDRSGKIVPYHPPFHLGTDNQEAGSAAPERRWRDGSLEIDLPMMQLKELFNVNHFIVSQANPHITPLLRLKEFVRAYGGNFACKVAHLVEMEVKHRCNQLLELGFTLGGLPRLFAQDWEGDVTVVMPATLAHYSKIITNPTLSELHKTSNQGRRCTWEKLSAIKANCGIELALDECVSKLNHIRQLKRRAKRSAAAAAASHYLPSPVRFNAYKRIPSWNCIARENSSGSLEDYFHAASSPRQGDVGRSPLPSPSPRNWRPHRNIFDHGNSDSESETTDSNCWTRCGGPLMRTNSSNDYTESVQNLEMVSPKSVIQTGARDPCYQKLRVVTPDRRNSFEFQNIINPVSSNSSILVGEGEFLQAERTNNGIMFNVVKKETLTPSTRRTATARDDSESVGVLDCPEKETDSTTSECGEDFDSAVDHFNVVEGVINTVEVC